MPRGILDNLDVRSSISDIISQEYLNLQMVCGNNLPDKQLDLMADYVCYAGIAIHYTSSFQITDSDRTCVHVPLHWHKYSIKFWLRMHHSHCRCFLHSCTALSHNTLIQAHQIQNINLNWILSLTAESGIKTSSSVNTSAQ